MVEEGRNQNLEAYREIYPLEEIPEALRDDFKGFLVNRVSCIQFYRFIPKDKFNKGSEPRKQLEDQLSFSKVRLHAFYSNQISPTDETEFQVADEKKIIRFLEDQTQDIYSFFRLSLILTESRIKLSDGKTIKKGSEILKEIVEREKDYAENCGKMMSILE